MITWQNISKQSSSFHIVIFWLIFISCSGTVCKVAKFLWFPPITIAKQIYKKGEGVPVTEKIRQSLFTFVYFYLFYFVPEKRSEISQFLRRRMRTFFFWTKQKKIPKIRIWSMKKKRMFLIIWNKEIVCSDGKSTNHWWNAVLNCLPPKRNKTCHKRLDISAKRNDICVGRKA